MATARLTAVTERKPRRTPVQRRSRERVERILSAAEQIVVEAGVEALSTRAVAAQADVPIATLYQYFADRDAIIAALIERHITSMDARIAAALSKLPTYSIRSVIEATVAAYRTAYKDRPSYVVLWFQGRASAQIATFIRDRDALLAAQFHEFALATGLLRADVELLAFKLCFEVADRFLEVAYRHHLRGDDRVVKEGVEMLVAHMERYATPAGIAGVDAREIEARWRSPADARETV